MIGESRYIQFKLRSEQCESKTTQSLVLNAKTTEQRHLIMEEVDLWQSHGAIWSSAAWLLRTSIFNLASLQKLKE